MEERTRYSVGFLHNDQYVVLIKKNRPDWQAGKHNGVGGHIEEGESPHECMVREFQEETGVLVPNWEHYATLEGTNAQIYVYAQYDTGGWMRDVKSVTDEEIRKVHFSNIRERLTKVVPNLEWLIPLMQQRGKYKPVTVEFYGD